LEDWALIVYRIKDSKYAITVIIWVINLYGAVMLRDFLIQEEFAIVPWSGNSVSVDKSGLIRSLKENIVEYRDENGDRCINANLYDGIRKYLVADVVAHSFKPVFIPSKYWNEISVMFLDGNKDNVHPGNLIWKFPIGLGADTHAGYAFIPGYSRYMVNLDGTIINFVKNKKINNGYSLGYGRSGVTPDNRKISTCANRHRLLALAWLDYPANVDKLEVNHINGIRGDDRIDNLEWVTQSQNALHAYAIGLNKGSNHIPVLVRNAVTKQIFEYSTITYCGEALGVSTATIMHRMYTPGQLLFTGNLQFKLKNDPTPWREIIDLELENPERKMPRPVLVRNVFTNEIKRYDTGADAAIGEGSVIGTVNNALCVPAKLPHLHFDIKYETDDTPWREYTKRELECFQLDIEKKRPHHQLKYKLVNLETNQEFFYSYIEDVEVVTGVLRSALIASSKRDGVIRKKWKIYYL